MGRKTFIVGAVVGLALGAPLGHDYIRTKAENNHLVRRVTDLRTKLIGRDMLESSLSDQRDQARQALVLHERYLKKIIKLNPDIKLPMEEYTEYENPFGAKFFIYNPNSFSSE